MKTNCSKFNKKVASTLILTTLAVNTVIPINVHALGNFDLKSSFISKEINEQKIEIAPGIVQKIYTFIDKDGKRIQAFVVEVNTKDTSTGIEAGTPNDGQVYGKQKVSEQAKAAIASGEQVVAAINADFFDMKTGEPLGTLYKDGVPVKGHLPSDWNFFGVLKDGTAVIGDYNKFNEVKSNLEEALGGHAILVDNGKIYQTTSIGAYREPRTAVGIKEDGSVFFVAIDGRQEPYSAGISVPDLAQLMVDLGAVQALNLDGGGSSTFISRSVGNDSLELKNKPSDGSERRVADSWLITTKVQADHQFSSAYIEPYDKSFISGSTINFSAKGRDKSGASAQMPTSGLTWSLSDSSFGTINDNGVFSSNGKAGQFEVLLNYNGNVVGRTWIEIALPDEIHFTSNQITLSRNSQQKLELVAKYDERNVICEGKGIEWEIPEGMGTVDENGVLHTGDKRVSGKIIAKVKGTDVSASIDVSLGQLPQVICDFENSISNWKSEVAGRGEKGSVQMVTASKEPVKSGNNSLKLNFDFTAGDKNSTLGVYAAPGSNIDILGAPTALGMWVYGTAESKGYWLRMSIIDKNGQSQNINLTGEEGINWTGWKYVQAEIPTNLQGPFKINGQQGIRMLSIQSGNKGPMTKGSIYIDSIKAVYGDEGSNSIENKTRIFGENRFQTAVSIAEKLYSGEVSNVVVANAYNYADQISASILGNKLKAPVLLVGNDSNYDKEAFNYIKEHMNKNGKVFVTGGKAAVTDGVVDSIKKLGVNNIERMEGQDRYETNIKTNNQLNIEKGTPIMIASGEGFADSLSVASIAVIKNYPILLTSKNTLSKDAEEYIKKIQPSKVYIIGGEGVVTSNVKNQVSKLTELDDSDITRIGGSDRYKTNMNVLNYFDIKGDAVAVASGVSFPDSLVGSVYAAQNNAPIVLVNNSMDVSSESQYIYSKGYKNCIIFGGKGVVSDSILDRLLEY